MFNPFEGSNNIAGGHSKKDQLLLVKIAKYIGFCAYRRSYLLWSPVIVPSRVFQKFARISGGFTVKSVEFAVLRTGVQSLFSSRLFPEGEGQSYKIPNTGGVFGNIWSREVYVRKGNVRLLSTF